MKGVAGLGMLFTLGMAMGAGLPPMPADRRRASILDGLGQPNDPPPVRSAALRSERSEAESETRIARAKAKEKRRAAKRMARSSQPD